MNDISNKTLAVLVVIAILISLVGLYLGLGKARIVTVGKGLQEPGLVNVTVISNVNIAVSGGVNFSQLLSPGDPTQSSHLGGAVCNQLKGHCNITVGSIGTTTAIIRYYATAGLFYREPATSNYFNASVMSGGGSPISPTGVLGQCNTNMWGIGTAPPLGSGGYKNVQVGGAPGQNIFQDCAQYEGFTMAIQIKVPQDEPSGFKTATLTFVGSEDLTPT